MNKKTYTKAATIDARLTINVLVSLLIAAICGSLGMS